MNLREKIKNLLLINDSAHQIALGAALGIFLGILPGTGPVAAVFLAHFLKLNRAAALLGSLLVNGWLTLVFLAMASKLGSYLLGLKWLDVWGGLKNLLVNFKFSDLFNITFLKL